MSTDDFKTTEQYFDPNLPRTHGQAVAVVSWTDATGAHEQTISAPVTLGKSPSAPIVVSDPSVSNAHVELTPTPEGVTVRDLRSTNGTHTDTMRIDQATIRGDFRLRLGRVELHVRQPGARIEAPLWPSPRFGSLLGQSVAMRSLFERLANVARSDETVLLQGETGTGKELVAAAIHEHSGRAGRPYIVVDCSTLNPNLAEAQLFGHVKGAFTGATHDREGAFEAADGGTLFLDEIGELPLEMQSRLLRALESRQVRRVGETRYRDVNVRVISASFRDLRVLVNQRTFREDLYYRLAVLPVKVPPLRERADDIPMLVQHFVSARRGAVMPTDGVMKRLMEHPWAGNVRELRNVVARASVQGWDAAMEDGVGAAGSGAVGAMEAGSAGVGSGEGTGGGGGGGGGGSDDELSPIGGTYYDARRRWIEKGERAYIPWLLEKSQQSMVRASVSAGIDPSTLRKIIRRLKGE